MERNHWVLVLMVGAAIVAAGASLRALGADQKEVLITVKKVSAYDGPAMYDSYCAQCHGPIGKGNGPIASQLGRHKVPDLTDLVDQKGNFDAAHVVVYILDSRAADELMPNWHRALRRSHGMDVGMVQLAAHNLADHIGTLQVKAIPAGNPRH